MRRSGAGVSAWSLAMLLFTLRLVGAGQDDDGNHRGPSFSGARSWAVALERPRPGETMVAGACEGGGGGREAGEGGAGTDTQALQQPAVPPLNAVAAAGGAAAGEAAVEQEAREEEGGEGGKEEEEEEWKEQRAAVRGRMPVVFLHWTMAECHHCEAVPQFLLLAIRVAVAAGNHVVLVGDEATRFLQESAVTWIPITALSADARALDSAYQHASSTPESYEKGCMQRAFFLRSLLRLLRLQRIVHLDSDVLLLVSGERWLAALEARPGHPSTVELPPVGGYWLRPRQSYSSWHWVESIATAIVSAQLLDALTDFILRLYSSAQGVAFLNTKIQEYVVKLGGEGGVCDMTAYYLFSHCVAYTLPPWSGDFPEPHLACPPTEQLLDIGNLWLEAREPGGESVGVRVSDWSVDGAGAASKAGSQIYLQSHPIGLPPGLDWAWDQKDGSGEGSGGWGRGGVGGDDEDGLETFDLNINESDGTIFLSG